MALPRSRTAWLSQFLTFGGWHCGHEQLRYMRGLDDVKAWLNTPMTGSAETAAAPFWRLLKRIRPDCRILIVRRPVAEVVDSLMRVRGAKFEKDRVVKMAHGLSAKLDQVQDRASNAVSIDFDRLGTWDGCHFVLQYCLGIADDMGWVADTMRHNIQCDLPGMMRYHAANKPQLDRLAATAKQAELAAIRRSRPHVSDGLAIGTEPFDTFLRDGAHLFAEHSVLVGEKADSYLDKNIPLFRKLYEIGCLQVVTARSNGRMFGYLLTLIGPSLEDEIRQSAVHTTLYASATIPGLGMKMQRFAETALRERGVDEAWGRSGVRGSGPKMDVMYRRLGYEFSGELHRLDLKAA